MGIATAKTTIAPLKGYFQRLQDPKTTLKRADSYLKSE